MIAALHRKPDVTVAGKVHGVNIARAFAGEHKFFNRTGLRIHQADMLRAITGIPGAAFIRDNRMRPGIVIQRVLFELAIRGIECGDIVTVLADEPDGALRAHPGITRKRFFPGYCPFRNRDLLADGCLAFGGGLFAGRGLARRFSGGGTGKN